MNSVTHVVVGAGAIGRRVTAALTGHGDHVRLITRSGSGPEHPLVERVAADATDVGTLTRLTHGAIALYNCANPPYHRWATDWPPIAASLLATACRTGAVLATVSNLYGYGPVDQPMTEDTPLNPTTVKGRVRAQMWLDALEAHRRGDARVTEARGSDYIGPNAQTEFDERVVRSVLAGRPVQMLGRPDAPHTWTYTGDMATMLVTAARDERAWGRAWHVPSNPAASPCDVVKDMCRLAGVPTVTVKRTPPLVMRAVSLVSPPIRALQEMRYQQERPFVMDSTAAQDTFGLTPTSWDDILRDTMSAHRAA